VSGRGLAKKTIALIEASIAILQEIQPATVRAVCYRLFVRGAITGMVKSETAKVSRALTTAREERLIPWSWIVDETRRRQGWQGWANPDAFVDDLMDSYRRDWWQDQPRRLLVISEKGTVGGMLRPVLSRYATEFLVLHGFGSATALNALATYSVGDPRPLTLLYVGDHDPSGRAMSDVDIPERLARYGGEAELVRLAVTPEQIAAHALETFPAHDKAKDARYPWFLDAHGERCCELDALDPNILRDIVKAAIVARIDRERWERAQMVQDVEAASVHEFLTTWKATLAS
jgi:hypothetical protein